MFDAEGVFEDDANMFRREREVALCSCGLYNTYKRRSLRMRKYIMAQ